MESIEGKLSLVNDDAMARFLLERVTPELDGQRLVKWISFYVILMTMHSFNASMEFQPTPALASTPLLVARQDGDTNDDSYTLEARFTNALTIMKWTEWYLVKCALAIHFLQMVMMMRL